MRFGLHQIVTVGGIIMTFELAKLMGVSDKVKHATLQEANRYLRLKNECK